jgi:hypothetical protein
MKAIKLLCGQVLPLRYILFPLIFILLGTASIKAKTIVIGNGSGFISVPDMNGLNPGDKLAIASGQYTGAAFNNLKGITITNNGGTVTFTGQVTLNTLVECEFSGFQFKNVQGISIRWDGISRRCVERNIYFQDCTGSTNDAADHNVYNGDTSSLKLYMCTFDSLTLFRSGMVMMGGWGGAKDLECYMDSIVFSRIKIDSTITNGSEVRGIIFRMDAHDWRVIYKGQNTGSGDIGLFLMHGDGTIHNIYRFGGRGYIVRIWNVGLKKPGNMYYYNNIDLNSSEYGSLDTRVDPVEFTQYTTGSNCYIFNNTAGNKGESIGYWSSLAVVGTYALPWVCQTRNNLGFNMTTRGKPPITMNQSSNTWTSDSSNNLYFDSPVGVVDPITCVPVANSPVLGKGLTLPILHDDVYHNLRIGAYDIGAVQHGGAIIPPPANQPPIPLTGSSQTLTLPVSNTILDGSKSYDPDGTISSYAWVLVSGTGGTLATPQTSTTKLSGLSAGTYIYKLTVTDNRDSSASALDTIVVKTAGNLPPISNAGADQTITLPKNSVTVDGSSSRDQDNGGLISTYLWTQGSGPSTALITTPSNAISSITGLQTGVYVFKLTVTDSSGAPGTDSLTVIVKDSVANPVDSNLAPIANVGTSITIFLPVNTATLDGSKSSDPDGTIRLFSWTKVSGPNDPATTGANTSILSLSGLVAGQYNYQLEVTDSAGATSSARVKITVVAAPNVLPVANAGADQTITAPSSTVSLNGSLSYDPDGTIATYNWVLISGIGSVTVSNANTANPGVSGLNPGTYTFQLTITDNSAATSKDQVIITVNPEPTLPNQQPVANAGTNLTITEPVNSITLNGSSSFDPDGTIINYQWSQLSGPSGAAVANNGSDKPTVTNLLAGTYVFQLLVTDNNGSSGIDQVSVTVNPAVNKINQSPVALAGSDTTIYLPARNYMLNASGSYDPDGNITSYQWQEISGPNTAVAPTMNRADIDLSNLTEGTYQFQLTVTDNQGAQSSAIISITVGKGSGSSEQLSVFPNPARDVITTRINSPINGTVRVNVYDMNGRTVLTDQSEKSMDVLESKLYVSALSPGMYLIQITIGNQKTLVTKFIKL